MEDVEQLLPNELLGSGYTDEVVAMATAQEEKYKCILPKSHINEEDEVCKIPYSWEIRKYIL